MHTLTIINSKRRPAYYLLAEYLWGSGCNIDSDGNSSTPEDESWTELSLMLRSDPSQQLDIDPVQESPLILKVVASTEEMALKVAEKIVEFGGGSVESPPNNSLQARRP